MLECVESLKSKILEVVGSNEWSNIDEIEDIVDSLIDSAYAEGLNENALDAQKHFNDGYNKGFDAAYDC